VKLIDEKQEALKEERHQTPPWYHLSSRA